MSHKKTTYVNKNLILALFVTMNFSCSLTTKNATSEMCLSEKNYELIRQSFKLKDPIVSNFQIQFISHDSWGLFNNQISIVQNDSNYLANSKLTYNSRRNNISDTTRKSLIIQEHKIEKIIANLDKLKCQPFSLDPNGNCCDGDYHKILLVNDGTVSGWMWDGQTHSYYPKTRKRYKDSLKTVALNIEGLIFEAAGFTETNISYLIDSDCQEDSTDIYITNSRNNYIVKSLEVSHPEYEFDDVLRTKIACKDTSKFLKELKIRLTTKTDEIINVTEIEKYK